MFCKNCGSKMEKGQLTCPFCGAESYDEALALHKEKIEYYREEERSINQAIHEAKSHRTIVPILIIFGAMLLIFIMYKFFFFLKDNQEKVQYEQNMNAMTKLEEAYCVGDYDKVTEIYESLSNRYDSRFSKYKEVSYIQNRYEDASEEIEEQKELAILLEDPYELSLIVDLLDIIQYCDKSEAEGYIHGEEAAVVYYKELTMEILEESFLMTSEEIEDAVDSVENDEEMEELCEILYQRILEQQ